MRPEPLGLAATLISLTDAPLTANGLGYLPHGFRTTTDLEEKRAASE